MGISQGLPLSLITKASLASLGYANGFYDYAGFDEGVYYQTGDGLVTVQGLIKNDSAITAGNTICTLPANVCPAKKLLFIVLTLQGPARVDVSSSGVVSIQTALPAGTWVSLSNIHYLAGQ